MVSVLSDQDEPKQSVRFLGYEWSLRPGWQPYAAFLLMPLLGVLAHWGGFLVQLAAAALVIGCGIWYVVYSYRGMRGREVKPAIRWTVVGIALVISGVFVSLYFVSFGFR